MLILTYYQWLRARAGPSQREPKPVKEIYKNIPQEGAGKTPKKDSQEPGAKYFWREPVPRAGRINL